MRWLFRLAGSLLILGGFAALAFEIWSATQALAYRLIPLGELWASLHANSLVGLQTGVEVAFPLLWWDVVLPILLWPAWSVLLGLGLIFRLIGLRRGAPRQRLPAREVVRLVQELSTRRTAARARPAATPGTPADAVAEPRPAQPSGAARAPAQPVARTRASGAASAAPRRKSGPTVVRGP